jgi:hypothetical protein
MEDASEAFRRVNLRGRGRTRLIGPKVYTIWGKNILFSTLNTVPEALLSTSLSQNAGQKSSLQVLGSDEHVGVEEVGHQIDTPRLRPRS